MTVLVGVSCSDGLVIGADSSATFGSRGVRTIEQPVEKVHVISDKIIVAGTGAVGLHQRFREALHEGFSAGDFGKASTSQIGKALAVRGIKDFQETGLLPGLYGALVGFYAHGEFNLVEYDVENFQPEVKTVDMWFASMGSGQPITDPFLAFLRKLFWSDGPPPLIEGIFAVNWALNHAIEFNTGGIKGPAQIAIIERVENRIEARLLSDNEIQEHNENMRAAEDHLRLYRETLRGETETEIPEP